VWFFPGNTRVVFVPPRLGPPYPKVVFSTGGKAPLTSRKILKKSSGLLFGGEKGAKKTHHGKGAPAKARPMTKAPPLLSSLVACPWGPPGSLSKVPPVFLLPVRWRSPRKNFPPDRRTVQNRLARAGQSLNKQ